MQAWHKRGLGSNAPSLLRVYNLLSGGNLGIEQKLFQAGDATVDWMRRLGPLLKYGREDDGSEFDFASLIEEYDCQVARGLAPPPWPFYIGASDRTPSRSILYHPVRLCDAMVRYR